MLESEIRPRGLMAEQAECFARDAAWLYSQRERFVEVGCPTCDNRSFELQWVRDGFGWVRCVECETVYANPRPSPDLLDEYYRRSENYAYWNEVIFPASEERRRVIFKERAERIAGLARQPFPLLVDIGAGFGTFCQEAARAVLCVVAVEPEPHLAETCRSKGIETVEAPFETADLPVADVITAFEVIEHLFSPRDFIARCYQLLIPGGLLVLTCPNVKGFEIEALGSRSKAVDHEHLNLMHPQSLTDLLRSEGFGVIESETPGRLDCDLVGVADGGLQDFLVSAGRSSHMWIVARR